MQAKRIKSQQQYGVIKKHSSQFKSENSIYIQTKHIRLKFLLQTNKRFIRVKNIHISIMKLRSVVCVFIISSQLLDVFVLKQSNIMEFNAYISQSAMCANGKHIKTLTYIFTVRQWLSQSGQ